MHLQFTLSGDNSSVSGKISVNNDYNEDEKPGQPNGTVSKHHPEREILPPPPLRKNNVESKEKQPPPPVARVEDEDIFIGEGVDYAIPSKDMSESPPVLEEDMEESPRKERQSYFSEPVYGPIPPSEPAQTWEQPVSRPLQYFKLIL